MVPALGGPERKLAHSMGSSAAVTGRLAWSLDAKFLAVGGRVSLQEPPVQGNRLAYVRTTVDTNIWRSTGPLARAAQGTAYPAGSAEPETPSEATESRRQSEGELVELVPFPRCYPARRSECHRSRRTPSRTAGALASHEQSSSTCATRTPRTALAVRTTSPVVTAGGLPGAHRRNPETGVYRLSGRG